MNRVEYIGFIATFCTTIALLPQVIKIYQSKSAKDIALLTYIISSIGIILWMSYGILIHSYSLIASNILTLSLTCIIIIMKIKWK